MKPRAGGGPRGLSGELCAVRGGGRPEPLLSTHVVFVTMPTEPSCGLSASKTSGLSKALHPVCSPHGQTPRLGVGAGSVRL